MTRKYYGEEKKPDREFSSTQVSIPANVARKMREMGKKIPDSALGEDGREDDAHITVKFGLHDAKPTEKLRKALSGFGVVKAEFQGTSLFKNDDFDVVKLGVTSPDLHRLNSLIAKTVACTDTHPTYQPHATLAYLKKGMGEKYAGDKTLEGQTVAFHSIEFSAKDRSVHVIHLV